MKDGDEWSDPDTKVLINDNPHKIKTTRQLRDLIGFFAESHRKRENIIAANTNNQQDENYEEKRTYEHK